jgi:hypothetical protein
MGTQVSGGTSPFSRVIVFLMVFALVPLACQKLKGSLSKSESPILLQGDESSALQMKSATSPEGLGHLSPIGTTPDGFALTHGSAQAEGIVVEPNRKASKERGVSKAKSGKVKLLHEVHSEELKEEKRLNQLDSQNENSRRITDDSGKTVISFPQGIALDSIRTKKEHSRAVSGTVSASKSHFNVGKTTPPSTTSLADDELALTSLVASDLPSMKSSGSDSISDSSSPKHVIRETTDSAGKANRVAHKKGPAKHPKEMQKECERAAILETMPPSYCSCEVGEFEQMECRLSDSFTGTREKF